MTAKRAGLRAVSRKAVPQRMAVSRKAVPRRIRCPICRAVVPAVAAAVNVLPCC